MITFTYFFIDEKVILKEYPTTINGMMDSWRERWTQEEVREIDVILDTLVNRNAEHFDPLKYHIMVQDGINY